MEIISMSTIWQSLAWKEWNEHKWKLVSILAVMWGLWVIVFLTVSGERDALATSFYVSVLLGCITMAIFIGLSAAAGERSRGTLSFLQSLPVPLWRVAIHKVAFALATIVIPIIITALGAAILRVVFPWIRMGRFVDFPTSFVGEKLLWRIWFLQTAGLAALMASSLVVWGAALGNNRKDEVSAGATALVLMSVWCTVLTAAWLFLLKGTTLPDSARLRAVGVASAPLGFLIIPEIAGAERECLVLGYVAAILVHLSLVARYVIRFGLADDYGHRSPRDATSSLQRSEFLTSPRRFAFTAIAWKQFRESSPVALAGLAAVVVISTCFCVGSWYVDQRWVRDAKRIYGVTAVVFGFFIALVAGIGVALQDLGSPLNTFWRSRPIQPNLWFSIKFVTALLTVLAAVYVPIGLFVATGEASIKDVMGSHDVPMIVASQVAVFAAAAMMTTLVRQAVYAAILSVAVVYVGILAYHIAYMIVYHFGLIGGRMLYEWWQITKDQALAGTFATVIVCTFVAWLATRFDWGRKGRY
jgi:hypothetical protein